MLCSEIKEPLVLDFIKLHMHENMSVLSKLSHYTSVNFQSSIPLIRDTYSVPSNAGVYI